MRFYYIVCKLMGVWVTYLQSIVIQDKRYMLTVDSVNIELCARVFLYLLPFHSSNISKNKLFHEVMLNLLIYITSVSTISCKNRMKRNALNRILKFGIMNESYLTRQ